MLRFDAALDSENQRATAALQPFQIQSGPATALQSESFDRHNGFGGNPQPGEGQLASLFLKNQLDDLVGFEFVYLQRNGLRILAGRSVFQFELVDPFESQPGLARRGKRSSR